MIWAGIVAAALCCYLLKLAGLAVPASVVENPRVRRLAAVLPVALLAALAASQTFLGASSSGTVTLAVDARLSGVAVAAVAIVCRAPFLLVILLAAVMTAGVRLLGLG
ncbi:MAG: AzlD domain-containing protein [Austwickia sp.]|jgi:branched-subunit amino acid transport protein|nr:AzlD domain-containing protein [Austwickia sp.]